MAATEADTRTLWFVDTLATIKVSRYEGEGLVSVIDCVVPPHAMPPLHVHHEDETDHARRDARPSTRAMP